jgi:NAD(P)-dependent dehydrogenase (short-subunit alcohol dehydrogenase family)
MHPLKALADPDDIAAAIEFLMSRDAGFITGQVVAVDGGLSSLHPHHAEDYGV